MGDFLQAVKNLIGWYKGLKTANADMTTQNNTLQSQIATMSAQITDLQAQLAGMPDPATISDLTAQINAAQ